MTEPYLTMAEIEAKYPNQWVLIANPKLTRYQEVIGGQVVLHCPDRAEFLRRFGEWDDPECKLTATSFTGKFPAEDEDTSPADSEPGAA